MTFPGFPEEGMKFLAGLARNNEREWFQPRKEVFEQVVKMPLVDFVSELNRDVGKVAPDHVVAEPSRAVSRIYRDTRFAKDKSPYKTNMYALWPHRAAERHGGPAFYLSLSAKTVEAGGGLWMPMPPMLARVRAWVDENHPALRKILAARKVKNTVGELYGKDQLTRVPRGFAPDHPAADLLRRRHFVLTRSWPAKSFATTAKIHKQVAQVFAAIGPFIAALDEACAL